MTTLQIILALVAAIPPTLTAIISLIMTLRNTDKLNEIHVSLNSRLSELVAASITQGRQVERDNTAGVISSLAAAIVKK